MNIFVFVIKVLVSYLVGISPRWSYFATKRSSGKNTIPVVFNTTYLKCALASCGMELLDETSPNMFVLRNANGQATIVGTTSMRKYSAPQIEGLLLHELGHLELGHLDGITGTLVDQTKEIEADTYAIDNGCGLALASVLGDIMHRISDVEERELIEERIAIIESEFE